MIAKWGCTKCGKVFYTDTFSKETKPTCQCAWEDTVHLIWVDFKPTKLVFDEIKESGNELTRKSVTKKDALVFSIACLSKNEDETNRMLDKLPF